MAIDIGASSGRHIVGWLEGGKLKTEELYRFTNGTESRVAGLLGIRSGCSTRYSADYSRGTKSLG